MDYKKCCQLINEIIKSANLHKSLKDTDRNIPFNKSGIYITNKKSVVEYQNAISFLFKTNKEVSKSYTFGYIEEEILNLVYSFLSTNTKCTVDDIICLYDKLLTPAMTETEILYILNGVNVSKVENFLGDFTIYKYPDCIQVLTEKYPAFREHDIFLDGIKPETLLGIKVRAREQKKKIEIADSLVKSFENTLNYIIGDLKHHRSIGVFTHRNWSNVSRITCSENNGLGFYSSNQPSRPITLVSSSSNEINVEHKKIFELITKSNKTNIEERILNAIEWAGKACIDLDNSKALMQFVFALECLLQYNDGKFIIPSIISQMSDWSAFIIGNDAVYRKKVAGYFKHIYQKRSAIAHGGKTSIVSDDLEIALQLVKLIVNAFLCTKPYCDMKKMDEVSNYIETLKFN